MRHNQAQKGVEEQPEEGQRKRVTNEIEEDESPAESTHVANEVHQIALGQVMAEVHGKRYIGRRQRVVHCVGLDYLNWRGNGRMRIDLGANYFHSEPTPDLRQNETRATSHIQYPMDR